MRTVAVASAAVVAIALGAGASAGAAPPCCPPKPVAFSPLGGGRLTFEPWGRNRVYYAATIRKASQWLPFVSRHDRRAVRRVNFSRYGVLAFFEVRFVAQLTVQSVRSRGDELAADIAVPRGCACPAPPHRPAIGSYVLVTIDKASLEATPHRLYVTELSY